MTPVVVPLELQGTTSSDPFEPLGRTLSRRSRPVRHVPYTKSQGVTGIHVAFIRRATAVVFVLTQFLEIDGVSQPSLAETVGEVCESCPLIVLACCKVREEDVQAFSFPTLVQVHDFSPRNLEAAADFLLTGSLVNTPLFQQSLASSPASLTWSIRPWNYDNDIGEAHMLWNSSIAPPFHLDQQTFGSLVQRNGYALHHVVRERSRGEMVGFCLTFTTFADSSEERLIGSIAALVVREDFRRRGIGRLLHDEALGKMHRIRGVTRIQLGSTFPRLLYGLPTNLPNAGWFERFDWVINQPAPGKGRLIADWILTWSEVPRISLASAGLLFRSCELSDSQQVINMVSRESQRKMFFGWFDQYARTIDSNQMDNIIIGFEGQTLVAAAITYSPDKRSPAALDLPWANSVGPNIGGVTCICIKGESHFCSFKKDRVLSWSR